LEPGQARCPRRAIGGRAAGVRNGLGVDEGAANWQAWGETRLVWCCHFARGNAAGLGEFGVPVRTCARAAAVSSAGRHRFAVDINSLNAPRAYPSTPY
jgi:hypothetical protein